MTKKNTEKKIDGKSYTVRELLAGRKYSIEYYQREYKWQRKQVADLIHDLSSKFLEDHQEGNDRGEVENYGHYFLGSIIVSDKGGKKYIIDGQQRLTTLTLLLTFLHPKIKDDDQKRQIAEHIFSQKYGKRSFNLDIPERKECMEALYNGKEFLDDPISESIANIIGCYANFGELFEPGLLDDGTLPYFADWLIENVHFIEITAYSDDDAYTIFETMNDRGLSLTPTEMLKGYLLANITDTEARNKASDIWKERVQKFQRRADDISSKDEDADSIKAWLRSQYAKSIRERKRGASPQDFERIGTEFHRWVRDNQETLNLTNSREFHRFIETDFEFYTRWHEKLRRAGEARQPELDSVYFNAQHHFTLQYPVLLAPLTVSDKEEEALRKLRLVSDYLDILIHRRIWNGRTITYSTMQHAMFQVIKEIRGQDVCELAKLLHNRLSAESETFDRRQRPKRQLRATWYESPPNSSLARTHDRFPGNAIRASTPLCRVCSGRKKRVRN